MSCSSNNTDSTALGSCTSVQNIDSTLLGHCANHNQNQTSTLLAHATKESAQQMCIKHCTISMGEAEAKKECEKQNNTTEKDGTFHWTKPADCILSCGR